MTPRAGDTAPRHDWSARARSTAMEALRYTQFVGVMKRALPAAAFAVIAAVLAFFFVARQPSKFSLLMLIALTTIGMVAAISVIQLLEAALR